MISGPRDFRELKYSAICLLRHQIHIMVDLAGQFSNQFVSDLKRLADLEI